MVKFGSGLIGMGGCTENGFYGTPALWRKTFSADPTAILRYLVQIFYKMCYHAS